MFGELSRMTQFKDKSQKHADNVNAGLFTYPVLMAADILLYQTNVVPIGADQKQHLELARNIVDRFNQLYPDTFTMPEPIIAKSGAKIMSLAEPTQKMSKSDENENAVVRILDTPDAIMRKFKRAVTDSDSEIRFDPENKPGVSNLLTIYSCFSGKSIEEAEREFDGKGYGDFKTAVGQVCCDKLIPVQQEYQRILADKAYLEEVMKKGADEASYYARKTLSKVRRKLGFVNL
jgi:tryptophanyl-tRNA synthetase